MKVVLFVTLLCLGLLTSAQQRGIQLRLTAKGLDYGMKQALLVLQKDLQGKRLPNFNGNGGGFKISVYNLVLHNLAIGNKRLVPSSAGLTAAVSGVTASISARFHYEKKVGWVKVSDTVNLRVRASAVSFSLSVRFGKRSDGRPTIAVNSCSAHVGDLNVDVSGSWASGLYKLIASLFESKLRSEIASGICKGATDSINQKGSQALAGFPVQVNIENTAVLDYYLTAAPVYNSQFMDVFVRGEFLLPSEKSSAVAPIFQTSADNSKMLYFWVSSFSLNSAADVIQRTGLLSHRLTDSDDFPKVVRDLLNTNALAIVVPELAARFPNKPLEVALHSYKAPRFVIEDGAINVLLFASAGLMVRQDNGTFFDAFTIHLDIKAAASVSLSGMNIQGRLHSFSFGLKIALSHIGTINIPTDHPFVNTIVREVLIPAANVFLKLGFPLPTIKHIALRKPVVTFKKDVIRVGVDVLYAPNGLLK